MAGALTMPQDGSEAIYTVAGVLILALGHRLNMRRIAQRLLAAWHADYFHVMADTIISFTKANR